MLFGLSLRELEAPASAALAVLLAFFHSGITGEEAGGAEGLLGAGVVFHQSAGEAHDDGAGLGGVPPAGGVDEDVDLAAGVGDFDGAEDGLAVAFAGEVVVELAV